MSILSAKTKIRFQDCDPFRHLNNGRYVDYFLNAREDQVRDAYGLNIYDLAIQKQEGWVVSTSHIAYFRPAMPFENVIVETQTIEYSDYNLKVEFRMYDEHKKTLKAFMWMDFVFIDLKTGRVKKHGDDLLAIFKQALLTVDQDDFVTRRLTLKEYNS